MLVSEFGWPVSRLLCFLSVSGCRFRTCRCCFLADSGSRYVALSFFQSCRLPAVGQSEKHIVRVAIYLQISSAM